MINKLKKYRSLNLAAWFGWVFGLLFLIIWWKTSVRPYLCPDCEPDYSTILIGVAMLGGMIISILIIFTALIVELVTKKYIQNKIIIQSAKYTWFFIIGLTAYIAIWFFWVIIGAFAK